MGSGDDLPMISPPSDSTQVEITPLKEKNVNAPETRRSPMTEIRKNPPAPAPAPAKPGATRPPTALNVPVVPRPPAPAAAPAEQDEDPEKLLRQYADHQKVKVQRLEQQLGEYKKVVAERDALKVKGDSLSKELIDARKQLEGASKAEEMVRDLQGKLDAAILSNSILSDEKEKLKKGLAQQTENLRKTEERAVAAEKSVAETQKQLAAQSDARRDADARVAGALEALQGAAKPSASRPPEEKPAPAPSKTVPISEAQTRPMEASKPSEEKPALAKPAGRSPSAPGRFSFLKK